MSVASGFINGGHYYSNIVKPVSIDLSFVVDSVNSNGLGVSSLKSNGFVEAVYMNVAGGPTGTPALGTARSYAALGASTVTNTGSSVLTGNLGLSPGSSITGFPPGTFSGVENIANVAASQAQASALAAYNTLVAHASTTIASALDGQTLSAGYYSFASGAATLATSAPGTLTLNGSATDIFVIKTATTLTTGAGGAATIALTGGALASNVYFVVGSSATINGTAGSTFRGNIIASVSITVGSGTVLGSLIALTGAVTFSAATVVTTQALVPAFVATGNPNPLLGYALIKFKNNFNKYLGGYASFSSPVGSSDVAVNSTSLVLGQVYVIQTLGTTTLADWLAIGLPPGFTPAVGQAFIAIKTGNGSGSGKVRVPSLSGVNSVEFVGAPNSLINNSSIAANGGAWLLFQFLSNGVLGAPQDGTVVQMMAKFDGSSVTVDGL